MNDHSSDESELDEDYNHEHEARRIDDNSQIEYDKQRQKQQIRGIIEPFES